MSNQQEPVFAPQGPSNRTARRLQENANLFSTIDPEGPAAVEASYGRGEQLRSRLIGLSATADSAGNLHLFIGACVNRAGSDFKSVFELDLTAGLVKILGQTLIVP